MVGSVTNGAAQTTAVNQSQQPRVTRKDNDQDDANSVSARAANDRDADGAAARVAQAASQTSDNTGKDNGRQGRGNLVDIKV